MRSARLLVIFIAFFSFSSTKLFSQLDLNSFADVYSQDSLQGFDVNLSQQKALDEGLYGKNYSDALRLYKRQFVMDKYNLHANYIPVNTTTSNSGRYSSSFVNTAPCVNEGFESGTLTGWNSARGINLNSQAYPSTPSAITAGQVSVVSLPLSDPFVGTVPVSPFTGNQAVRINDQNTGAVVIKLSQTFPVTSSNYVYEFAYLAVMEDAPNHDCSSTPYMQVRFLNNAGTLQNCPSFSIIAPGSGTGGCAGVGPLTWVTTAAAGRTVQTSSGWQKFSVDLGSYITTPLTSNITVEIIVGDCSQTGHFGYAYFDSNCNTMNLSVNGTPVSMPSPTVFPQVQCGTTATLGAPAGFSPFVWRGPAGSGINGNTTQTISTSVPGNYTLAMSPVGICNPPLTKIINLQFVPPTTVSASPANLCASGTNTSSTLSASGATNYTWMPGGSNSSTLTVSPTSTTIYTLTAQTGTCLGTYTVAVTVNPDPTINVFTSNTSLCPGQTATLTATGANTYVWNPGALTGSQVTVSQTMATTYTTVGTSTAGCTATVLTTIGISASPNVAITPLTPTNICRGGSVTMVATGASIVWQPGGSTNPFETFSPSATTTYTAFGSSGSCTSSATQLVMVDPGPPITLSLNPAVTCPGNTTTLSAVAPLAIGAFTWNPGAINASFIAVTSSMTGGYSVSAVNAMGCRNTETINPVYSPLVNVVISPASPSICSGNSATLTATGALNYTWNPGGLNGSTAVLTPTSTQTYTVTGENGAGCVNQTTVTVSVLSNPTVFATVNPTAVCPGGCATITPGGTLAYTITGGSMIVCPTGNTVVALIGENAAGCISAPLAININVNPVPSVSVSANPATICAGASSTLTATGAVSYVWSNGSTFNPTQVSPSSSQTFSVTGTNAFGCTTTATVAVNVTPIPLINITPSSASVCPGISVNANATGATNYTWTPGPLTGANVVLSPLTSTNYTIVGATGACTAGAQMAVTVFPTPAVSASFNPGTICAGSCATLVSSGAVSYVVTGLNVVGSVACPTLTSPYSVVGTDANGCTSAPVTGTLFVNSGPLLAVSASPASICEGSSSTLTASGAVSYTWSTGSNSPVLNVTPLITETFTVTGANALGCTSTTLVTVNVTPSPTLQLTPSSPTICPGGSAVVNVTGAATYTLNGVPLAGSSATLSPLVTTSYTVSGTLGTCSSQTVLVVTVAPSPVITASFLPGTICAGDCATLSATGTVTNYIVSGLANPVACPATTSTYAVVGVSADGCLSNTVTGTVFVTNGPALLVAASPASICAGSSSTLTANGAVSYIWSNGGTGASTIVNPTVTETFTVIGTNAAGCSSASFVTVFVNSTPVVGITPSSTTICDGSSITLSATGAGSYNWFPGNIPGNSITVTPSLTTTYTVIGSNGTCSDQATALVTVNPKPIVSGAYTPTTVCPGSCATLSPVGALTYTTQGLSAIACPLSTSGFTLTGTNAFGCVSDPFTGTLFVLTAPAIFASANPTAICPGDSSLVTATGGISYTWQPVNLTVSSFYAKPSVSTIYTVTGSNAIGCTGTQTVSVIVTPVATIFATSTPTAICSGASATLLASGSGNYLWMPGSLSGANVFVMPVVTTTYVVTGNTGACSSTASVVVVVNQTPTVSVVATSQTICAGGSVTLTANGATSYNWSDGPTGPVRVVTPSVTTTYNVLGSGSSGCVGNIASITISVIPLPSITAVGVPTTICAGGSVSLTATGASNYNWQPVNLNGSTINVNPSATTIYTVTGTSAGCSSTATIAILVTAPINITALASPAGTICAGSTVNLVAGGAVNYVWSPGSLPASPSITVSPLATTIYTVVGTNGPCIAQTTVAVNVISAPTISISATTTSLCAGSCATLVASGATSYTWSTGVLTPSDIVCPLSSTNYSVIGGIGSCTSVATKFISVNPAPSLTVMSTSNPLCSGSSADIVASGATAYLWSNGSTTQTITVSPAVTTVYTVTGFSAGGCSASMQYTLFVNPGSAVSITPSTPSICAGFTVGLLAFSAPSASYTWFPGGSTANPLIDSPTSTTTYTVLSNTGGCTSSATITIVVNPLPSVSLTANPQTLCAGNTTTLTASGAVTYSWIPSLAGGNTFTDNPTSTTVYTVVGFDAAGCPNFAVSLVSVVPAPTIQITASSTSICAGSSATLTASGATNYTWMPGSQSGSMIVVSPSTPTTYTLRGDNGGCANIYSVAIGIYTPSSISAVANTASICPGDSVILTASGGVSYTWTPPGLSGASITDHPAVSTNYTVTGSDLNGCTNTANVFVFVNPMANITAVASPSDICEGGTVTLTGSGGLTYTWNPGNQAVNQVTVTPIVSTVYTLIATDGSGCTGSFLVPVIVYPNPTITVSPLNPSICLGTSATLTATGATSYTWLPGGSTSSVVVESPTSLTTYTVLGDNGGICFTSYTFNIYVNPLPQNVTATSTGTISCSSPTVALTGASTDTNVTYFWFGPQSYTAIAPNAVVTGIWGTFTLNVIDNVTGCVATVTVDVPTDNSIPLVNASTSGSITCSISTVTLNAANTTTNPAYSWAGPSNFTSTVQSPTVNMQGSYTITVTDLSSTCSSSAVVTVGMHTVVAITASIAPATCSGASSNNDGSISVSGFTVTDKYDIVTGTTYTGIATYNSAATIPLSGIITNNLANPTTTLAYTIRLFDGEGCIKDTTLYLVPVDCSMRTLGIAKAVSTPSLNSDGSYNITYKVVVKNYDLGTLKDIQLTENLANTFPNHTTFAVVSSPTVNPPTSGLSVNANFDGTTQTNLLASAANTLASGIADTVTFTLKVRTSLYFTGFKNSVIGIANNPENFTISDSSNTGLDPDPDNDKNPYNNNIPTIISFDPNVFFGITKVGEIRKVDSESYDVTYTVTVHNLGNDTIRNVELHDNLFANTIKNPATYSMKSGPFSDNGGLVANSLFNGNTSTDLVIASDSKMAPGTISYVYFTINVVPGTVTAISNSAYGSGLAAINPTQNVTVSDTSNAGTNPDINGNGIWNEPSDNVPTVLLVPNTHSLFIPEGFSPDGDNNNQYFVIQGLPEKGNNPITVFNRWGNKVYYNANYDNTWDGTPNVTGTLGKDKLPPGTYYYILEMKGSGLKPITGFVVLQY